MASLQDTLEPLFLMKLLLLIYNNGLMIDMQLLNQLDNIYCALAIMKSQVDKNMTERVFVVGDLVFLKLQPYAQSSVVHRANHKVAFKFYGPYRISEKMGEVAYRLELPATSRIHPVFHAS